MCIRDRFKCLPACGDRTLQVLRQSPRQQRHAKISTGGTNPVCAQQYSQEIASVPRNSRQRLGSPSTTRRGENNRPPVGPGAKWSNRGAIQDALGGTLRTVLGAGNGYPTLSHPHFAVWAGTPDQHSQTDCLYRRMCIGAAQRELSWNNGERFLAPGCACVPRAEWLRRDTVLPKGAHFRYKGDDGLWRLGKISASATEDGVYLVRFLDDPGPIKLPLPPARYTTSTGAVRGSWCFQVHEASAFPRGIQRKVN